MSHPWSLTVLALGFGRTGQEESFDEPETVVPRHVTCWPAPVRVSLLGAYLLALAAFGSMACEDNGIGRPCDILADAGQTAGRLQQPGSGVP